MKETDCGSDREPPIIEQEVTAAQWPQRRLSVWPVSQAIGPNARRIDDAPRLNFERFIADAIAERRPANALRRAQESFRRHIVERQRAVSPRLLEDAQHEARIIRFRLEIGPAAFEPRRRQ